MAVIPYLIDLDAAQDLDRKNGTKTFENYYSKDAYR